MKRKHTISFKRQSGMSLVGVLMGISLSMLSMLACTSMYTNHQLSSMATKNGSEYSSQLIHTMMVFHKELSNAGFGIPDAGPEHIMVHTDTTGRSSLYWRYFENGSIVCRGLRESQITRHNKQYRSLSIIQANIGCSDTQPFEAMTWVSTNTVAQWKIDTELAQYLADSTNPNGTLIDFVISASPVPCSPYNVLDPTNIQPHHIVSATAPTLAQLNGNTTVAPSRADICITNI